MIEQGKATKGQPGKHSGAEHGECPTDPGDSPTKMTGGTTARRSATIPFRGRRYSVTSPLSGLFRWKDFTILYDPHDLTRIYLRARSGELFEARRTTRSHRRAGTLPTARQAEESPSPYKPARKGTIERRYRQLMKVLAGRTSHDRGGTALGDENVPTEESGKDLTMTDRHTQPKNDAPGQSDPQPREETAAARAVSRQPSTAPAAVPPHRIVPGSAPRVQMDEYHLDCIVTDVGIAVRPTVWLAIDPQSRRLLDTLLTLESLDEATLGAWLDEVASRES